MAVAAPNRWDLFLDFAIPPKECTTVTLWHDGQAQLTLLYQSLPGNVNLSGTSNTQDLLALIQALNNGAANQPANLDRNNVNRSVGGGSPALAGHLLRWMME